MTINQELIKNIENMDNSYDENFLKIREEAIRLCESSLSQDNFLFKRKNNSSYLSINDLMREFKI
jgi:hypothetical protein